MNNKVINAEMLTHVSLCTHKQPQDVLVLSDNEEITVELGKYKNINIKQEKNDASFLEKIEDSSIDVVIFDNDSKNTLVFSEINRVLKKDGLAVISSKGDNLKEDMKNLGASFRIIMDYRYITENSFQDVILASKRYHPTADIILQRADMLDNLKYYNPEIHLGVFSLPTYMKKDLLGIQKN